LPRQSFLGHSGHGAEPTWLGTLNLKKWLDIQNIKYVTAAHFVVKCHAVKSLQYAISAGIVFFQSLSDIHDHSWRSEKDRFKIKSFFAVFESSRFVTKEQ